MPILETLVTSLFDHSGTFPPAARALEDALRDAARFPESLERPWIVSSDIVLDRENARRMAALDLREYGFSKFARVCLLVPGSRSEIREITHGLERAVERDGVARRISSLEVKVTADSLAATIDEVGEEAVGLDTLLVIEPDLSGESWQRELELAVGALTRSPVRVALKCRCTGPTGIGAAQLAAVLVAASDALLPLKVTGGLHHPVVEAERYGNSIGFLNLVVAFSLRRVLQNGIGHTALAELLVNSDPAALSFAHDLHYQSFAISKQQAEGVKAGPALAIGSCSLSEPDADLVRLYGRPD
jgi:hypothetical protein